MPISLPLSFSSVGEGKHYLLASRAMHRSAIYQFHNTVSDEQVLEIFVETGISNQRYCQVNGCQAPLFLILRG